MSRERYGLLVLAMLAGARRSDRVLVVGTGATNRSDPFPQFDHPLTVYEGAIGGAGSFDIAMVEEGAGAAGLEQVLGAVRDGGAVVLIEPAPPASPTVREIAGRLMRTGLPGRRRRLAAHVLARRGLVSQATVYAEPDVPRLRRVTDPEVETPVGHRRWRQALAGYARQLIQPPQRCVLARSSGRASVVEAALGALRNPNSSEEETERRFQVRLCRLSGTHVLLFRVVDSFLGDVFLRFPLNEVAARRAERHHAMQMVLHDLGYDLAPAPLGAGRANGFPFFAERAKEGMGVSFSSVETGRAVAYVSAALDALEALHRLEGESRSLDEAAFDRHVGARIALLRQCLRSRGRDDRVCSMITELLRPVFLGRPIRTGLCHGNPWLPNYLFDDAGVTAVVDWDMSERGGCCYFDVASLLTSTFLRATRRSVNDLLDHPPDEFQALATRLEIYHRNTGSSPVGFRETVLCYWLDRVASHQSFGRLTDEWFEQQVEPVARHLQDLLAKAH